MLKSPDSDHGTLSTSHTTKHDHENPKMSEEEAKKPVVAFLGPKASYTHQVGSSIRSC